MNHSAKDVVTALNAAKPPIEAYISSGTGKRLWVKQTDNNSNSLIPKYVPYPIRKDGTIPDAIVSLLKSKHKKAGFTI